mmetsp:Transcript_8808/g.18304  ORF Transcript_8808/g.18304 Transcript_8808/m.18304 type:complete len:206 (+) Transcript_8808:131-748(+)
MLKAAQGPWITFLGSRRFSRNHCSRPHRKAARPLGWCGIVNAVPTETESGVVRAHVRPEPCAYAFLSTLACASPCGFASHPLWKLRHSRQTRTQRRPRHPRPPCPPCPSSSPQTCRLSHDVAFVGGASPSASPASPSLRVTCWPPSRASARGALGGAAPPAPSARGGGSPATRGRPTARRENIRLDLLAFPTCPRMNTGSRGTCT